MRAKNVKSKRRYTLLNISSYGKNCIRFLNTDGCGNIFRCFDIQPSVVQYYTRKSKLFHRCSKYFDFGRNRVDFFISRYLTRRDKIDKLRHKHRDVIIENIKTLSNNRFEKIESHLKHSDYKSARSALNEIKKQEFDYNKKTNEFAQYIGQQIEDAIHEICPPMFLCEENDKEVSCYNKNGVIEHFFRGLGKFNLTLSIRDDNTLTTTNSILLARIDKRTDGKVLQDIKEKIEILQPCASRKLRRFVEERNKIIASFNNDFIPKISDIITTIEDDGLLKGGCGLTYCPIMKYKTEKEPDR